MPVMLQSGGLKAEIVEGSGFKNTLKLTADIPRDPDARKPDNIQSVWEIPSYYLDDLIRLLPILQQMYHDR